MVLFLIQALGSVGALSYLNVDLRSFLKPKSDDSTSNNRESSSGGGTTSSFLPSFIAHGRSGEGEWSDSRAWGLVSSLTSAAYLGSVAYSLYKLSALVSREHSYQTKGLFPKRRAQQRLEEWKWVPHTLHHGRLVNKDGLLLALHEWHPPARSSSSKGVVLMVHGVGQHALAYSQTASLLADRGFTVLAIDLQGHGSSEGDRFYFKRFEDLGADVTALIALACDQYKEGTDMFLLGISSGALVAMEAASKLPKDALKGLILVGPAFAKRGGVAIANSDEWKTSLSRALSEYLPKVRLARAIDAEDALVDSDQSRDVLENDPLMADGTLPARTAWELSRATAAGMRRLLSEPNLPQFYVLQGDQDLESEPVKPGEHKRSIPQGRHLLLLDEKTQPECVELMVRWMDVRLSAQAVASQWASSVTSALKQTISQKLSGVS